MSQYAYNHMDMGVLWVVEDRLFWFMFVVFLIFLGMFLVTNIVGLGALMGLWGLAFGFKAIHAYGYMEGFNDGKTESNKTES